jgi:hypothetical protein
LNTGRSDRWIGRAGFACGLATVAAVMVAARVPDQPHDLGLDLSVVPAPSTALTVKPSGPLVTIAGMRAGERSGGGSGNATLINPTSETQRIRLRAIPSSHALDRALSVEITVAGRRLYSGSLGGLRGATRASVDLPSGNGIPLHARVWLAAGARGWRGRIEDVDLAFDASPVTAR